MSVKDFRNHMIVLAHEHSLNWIAFHGGEPFLFYKTLKRCIEIAHKFGQERIEVATSGYWGGNQTHAQRKLQELKIAGLSSILFSVDAFHQKFIPFHSVHTAIDAARTVGFDEIMIVSRFLDTANSKNPFNSRTEESIERLRLPEDFAIVRCPLEITGRASDQLTDYLRGKARYPHGKCILPAPKQGTLTDPKAIDIDFMGNVTLCPGLCIGNTNTTPLSRIIREYDYTRHPIIKLLAENGPHILAELPEIKGSFKQSKYVSECHLCYEARRQLRACYPEFLAPEDCYKDQ